MALAHLSIGTATDRIDLLDVRGFHCGDWEPAAEDTDDTFSESSLSDYRRLTSYRRTTTIEAIPLTLKRQGQNAVIQSTQNLRKMIEMAKDYWAEDFSQPYPVYLQARASCETNMRYALVHDVRLPRDSNPYREPFLQPGRRSLMTGLVLGVERGAWTENPPGTGTAIELSAIATYDGRTLGNVDDTETRDPTTAEGEVYIGNKWNKANITDAWWWDASAAAWCGANLMDAALPFAFLPPAPLQVDDLVVFGIDTSLADSGPFASLVFDIGTALGVGGGITIRWRYSDAFGADPTAWTRLDSGGAINLIQDNTNADGLMTGDPFDTIGVRSAHWTQPAGWTAQNPQVGIGPALGITGLWVCAHVTAAAGAPTPPTQQHRDIYTITWPYTEVQAAEIGGDFPALLQMRLRNQSDRDGTQPASDGPLLCANHLLVGARSIARGEDFSAYVNFSNEQNPPGWTIGATTGAFVNDLTAPTGLVLQATPPAATRYIYAILDSSYVAQYHGLYRWFLRAKLTTAGAYPLRPYTFGAAIGGRYKYLDYVHFQYNNELELLDLGMVQIPDTDQFTGAEQSSDMQFGLEIYGDGAKVLTLYDMILLPVDEWAADLYGGASIWGYRGAADTTYGGNGYLMPDSIAFPKYAFRTLLRRQSDDVALEVYRNITNNSAILRPGERQRLWFLQDLSLVSGITFTHGLWFEDAMSAQAWRQQRYFSMRGDQ